MKVYDANGKLLTSAAGTVTELNDVGDVNASSPTDGYVLYWDATAGKWQVKAAAGVGTVTTSSSPVDNDIAKFTAATVIEGRSYAELKADLNLEIGTDILAEQTIGIADDNLLEVDGSPNSGEFARFTANGLEGRTEAEFKGDFNLEIGTDVQAYDAELAAIAGLTSAANKLPYFTGLGAASLADLTAFARTILDDADEATFKATVNLEIGTDVLAYDTGLSNLAGVAMVADRFYYTSADNVHVAAAVTAFARSILDDADEATFKATVNLEIGTDVLAEQTIGIADNNLLEVDDAGPAAAGQYARFTANGLEGRTEAEFKGDFNLEIGTDVLAQQTVGIADDNLLEVDGSPSDGQYARFTSNGLVGVTNVITLTFIIDGGGSAITTGEKGHLEIPFACTITQVTALADQSGSIVVDIWKDTYANFPPDNADSITASAPVTISTATKSQDSTLTGWTTAITAGDTLAFNVDSITTCERVTISLRVTKT